MKRNRYLILTALIIICLTAGFLVSSYATKSDYNPNYADAIQQKKPELCQNISYALQSGPTDGIDKVYGKEAIEVCKSQAKAGFFGCECDSASVIDNMRKR